MKFDIYNNGIKINTIISDEEFCKRYCKSNQYTYKEVIPEVEDIEYVMTSEDEIYAMLIDQEYRLTLIEFGLVELGVSK